MKTRKTQYILLLILLLLCGCAKEADVPPQTAAPTTVQTLPTAETMDAAAELAAVTEPPEPPTAMVPEAEASGELEQRCEKAVVDYLCQNGADIIIGFIGGWILILFAKKILAPLLQRDEDYYDGGKDDE